MLASAVPGRPDSGIPWARRNLASPPVGVRPVYPGKRPPYRPDQPCYRQQIPDVNSARTGRMGELQNLATFLIAPGQCDWLTGQSIMMDGGNALATGGSFYDTNGDVVTRILPGGDHHAQFNAYLDRVARLAQSRRVEHVQRQAVDRDAFAQHVALAIGAGRPTMLDMPNGLARGGDEDHLFPSPDRGSLRDDLRRHGGRAPRQRRPVQGRGAGVLRPAAVADDGGVQRDPHGLPVGADIALLQLVAVDLALRLLGDKVLATVFAAVTRGDP